MGADPYLWYINNKKYTKFFIAQSGEGEAKVPQVTASATKTGTYKSCAQLRQSPSDVTSATHIRIEGGKTKEVRDTSGASKGFMVIFSSSGGDAVLQGLLRELCGLTDPSAEPAEDDAEEDEEAALNSFAESPEFSELTSKSVGTTSTAPPPLSNSALRPN